MIRRWIYGRKFISENGKMIKIELFCLLYNTLKQLQCCSRIIDWLIDCCLKYNMLGLKIYLRPIKNIWVLQYNYINVTTWISEKSCLFLRRYLHISCDSVHEGFGPNIDMRCDSVHEGFGPNIDMRCDSVHEGFGPNIDMKGQLW